MVRCPDVLHQRGGCRAKDLLLLAATQELTIRTTEPLPASRNTPSSSPRLGPACQIAPVSIQERLDVKTS